MRLPSTPAVSATAVPAATRQSSSSQTPPVWRRLVCSLLLAVGLTMFTAAPMAQPAFADEWCSTC
jgi:hypothetical protein